MIIPRIKTRYLFLTIIALFLLKINAYAGFEVEPMKVHIRSNHGFATVTITSKDSKKKFSLELKEGNSKQMVTDLSFSPTSFSLMPNKTQLVRIVIKPGVNYTNKNYFLHIKTNDPNILDAAEANAFKIPIFIDNYEDTSTNNSDTNKVRPSANGSVGPGLTQLKISVPVTAVVP